MRESLGRLIRVGLDGRKAQALDILEQPRRPALAEHFTEERAEQAHIGAHLLGYLLTRFVSADEVDGFGPGQFIHGFHRIGQVFHQGDV